MNIGLDLDNTIILYDELFHRLAIERNYIPVSTPANKTLVRDVIRELDRGEELWTALQAEAYGPRIKEARIADGFHEFVQFARTQSWKLSILSHKTEFAASDSRISLREAANDWMSGLGFFEADILGFRREDVQYFETRKEKLSGIAKLQCEVFVDDLIEVLNEQEFPSSCFKIWYCPAGTQEPTGSTPMPFRCTSWREIQAVISDRFAASS